MNRQTWAVSFLNVCGLPYGTVDLQSGIQTNILSTVVWINSEGSNAKNNPLDTEQPTPTSTDYNSVGVKNYSITSVGLEASRTTLFNGYYGILLATLQRGNNATDVVGAINKSVWGSKPTLVMLDQVRANYVRYATIHVAGTGSTTTPLFTSHPQPVDNQLKDKKIMGIAIGPDGKVHIDAVGTNGHQYHFVSGTNDAVADGWSIDDITAAIKAVTGTTYLVQA